MLNMERMVGTITPKKVFSFRGSGLPWASELESGEASGAAPHATVATDRPHIPEVIRGVRSFDMAAGESFKLLGVCLNCETEIRKDFWLLLK